ncbi:MAG: hypothetical protein H6Q13_2379 [Bacteroidetes bacterium]|nr:hypothetical protein [Bacteroidota bacterium]
MHNYTYLQISLYHKHKASVSKCLLDDRTCEDLNMNDFFSSIDETHSCIGQQYLYHILHYNHSSEVEQHEELIKKLSNDKALRDRLIATLQKLGHSEAYSLASIFIDSVPNLSMRELRLIFVARFLPFLFFVLAFITSTTPFLILFFLCLVLNLILHYRSKSKMQSYYFSVPQLFKLLRQADILSKEIEFINIRSEISQTLTALKGLKKHLSVFRLGIKLDNDVTMLAYLLTELLHIFFLTEAYSVTKAFILLRDKKKQIEEVFCFVGLLDTLCSVSLLRERLPYYCLPHENSEKGKLRVEDIYHPLISNCVSNDLFLLKKSVLITGSNMAGKTSFIRAIGINLLAAKVLHTCFARTFDVPFDMQIYSAIHTFDNLIEGKSYFLEEAEWIKKLLIESQRGNCLFLLDELFKGTNTRERVAISKAVLLALSKNGNIVFASTHDVELGDMLTAEYDQYHFCESVKNETLSFDYKLKEGVGKEQNAIRILEIYGYPQEIIQDARSFANMAN